MLPLYAAITGGLLAWYRSRQLKKEVKDVPWAKKAYETLYDAESDENCDLNYHLRCNECRICLDCNPEADAGGAVCRFCTGESIERYDAEDDWMYNLQPQSILQSALGYGLGPELYYANADTHAYTMAYNEGHRDARNQSGYKPDIDSRLDKVAFRDAYKLRAESEIVSRKKKGKVISMIGSDPRLRKLKKDKDITPEEAMLRKEIAAETGAESDEAIKCGDCGRPATHSARGGTVNRCDRCWPGDDFRADPNNWAAENWGGDPEGPLAKALAKARATLKKNKKLNISKLQDPHQKSLDEFNGAVVWKEPKGIVEKVMVREMAIQQLRLNDAILELEQYIRLGMISEEDAFRKIVAMSQ
jgi:hypothetical protein